MAKEPNPSPNRMKVFKERPPASPAPPKPQNDLITRIKELEDRLTRLEWKVDDHIYIDP